MSADNDQDGSDRSQEIHDSLRALKLFAKCGPGSRGEWPSSARLEISLKSAPELNLCKEGKDFMPIRADEALQLIGEDLRQPDTEVLLVAKQPDKTAV
jgi:hypothetical protein